MTGFSVCAGLGVTSGVRVCGSSENGLGLSSGNIILGLPRFLELMSDRA